MESFFKKESIFLSLFEYIVDKATSIIAAFLGFVNKNQHCTVDFLVLMRYNNSCLGKKTLFARVFSIGG